MIESSSALQRATDVVAANRRLILAINEWEESRRLLELSVGNASWFGRFGHKRRLAKDQELRASVARAVARRKRSAGGVKITSGSLPAHDWLKDAWR